MTFVKVAKTETLSPGQGMVVEADGRELALFNVEGEFFCIDNECPHRDGPLGEGEVEDDTVICPWHAWQINIKTGEVQYNAGMCVATHACKIEDGDVLVEI